MSPGSLRRALIKSSPLIDIQVSPHIGDQGLTSHHESGPASLATKGPPRSDRQRLPRLAREGAASLEEQQYSRGSSSL